MNAFFSKLFGNTGGSIIDSIGNVADKFITTKEEKERFKIEAQKALMELQQSSEKDYLQDMVNARDLQKSALGQLDNFSKRFIYYLAAFIVLSATGFGFCLFFVNVPEENRRLVEMFSDVYLFAGALSVLNFFYGSSQGSKDKSTIIESNKK